MEKYCFEFKVNSGFDVPLTKKQVEHGLVDEIVDLYIANSDFGEIDYSGHSEIDLFNNDDGTYDVHMRVYGTFITTQIGEDFEECKEKAVAAYENADFGEFVDESVECEIVNSESVALSWERLSEYITASHNSEKDWGFHASNIDQSGFDIVIQKKGNSLDCYMDVSVYYGNKDDIDDIHVSSMFAPCDSKIFEKYLESDLNENDLIGKSYGISYDSGELNTMLENIVTGRLDEVELVCPFGKNKGEIMTMRELLDSTALRLDLDSHKKTDVER